MAADFFRDSTSCQTVYFYSETGSAAQFSEIFRDFQIDFYNEKNEKKHCFFLFVAWSWIGRASKCASTYALLRGPLTVESKTRAEMEVRGRLMDRVRGGFRVELIGWLNGKASGVREA